MGAKGDAIAKAGYQRSRRGHSDIIPTTCPQFGPDHPDVRPFRSFTRREPDHS